jgi:hypothetical protein
VNDDDLVRRLHRLRATRPQHSPTDRICKEAAIRIEQLQADNARLTAALDDAHKTIRVFVEDRRRTDAFLYEEAIAAWDRLTRTGDDPA